MIHSLPVQHTASHGKTWSAQVNAYFLQCLPLCFTICHCKTGSNGELQSFELERQLERQVSEGVLSLLRCLWANAIRRYVSVYPLPACPELLFSSAMEALRLSRQDNHSSSLLPPLNSGNKQNSKGCAFVKYI